MSDRAGDRGVSRTARQGLVATLLQTHEVTSQTELTDLLAAEGVAVTQGTVSKDLLELGAVRTRSASGTVVYSLPDEVGADRDAANQKLAKVCTELLVSADASANLALAHTPPGAAQYFASALDRANWSDVLGTIAGDDTIMIITRDPEGGATVAERLLSLAATPRAGRTRSMP
ncbi:arginine repressor [Aestuariimicrobium kwangyangense]|uniref:arginine repressor n=1 Tax=Aestuariimicrobium kwangyangense TaxID=396389 RepID=UPI0003B7B4DB|nr:arginine repressor [Aestuariimicrobium kwangyangense]